MLFANYSETSPPLPAFFVHVVGTQHEKFLATATRRITYIFPCIPPDNIPFNNDKNSPFLLLHTTQRDIAMVARYTKIEGWPESPQSLKSGKSRPWQISVNVLYISLTCLFFVYAGLVAHSDQSPKTDLVPKLHTASRYVDNPSNTILSI